MSINYPVKIIGDGRFVTLIDANDRMFAGGLEREDAEEIVNRLNAQPRRKSKRLQVEEALKRSDLTAQLAEREDIEWGHHDCLPRGEHVARLGEMKHRT